MDMPPDKYVRLNDEIDVQEFLPDLEEMDISDEEKIEFLLMLVDIMKRFVDLGFGEDSVSIIQGVLFSDTDIESDPEKYTE